MFDPPEAPFAVLQRLCSATRARACAAAERLVAIADLLTLRTAQSGETADWAVDATDAVTAEVAATLSISHHLAASHVTLARALREQLPLLGRVFIAGDIDEDTFRTCVFRTGLITDPTILTHVDAALAALIPRWGATTRAQLAHRIDKVIADRDLDAVRRRRDRIADRAVIIGDVDNGLAEIHATVCAPDGHALAARLTALAATVCPDDPRTTTQRRADAIGALAAGADRLGCRCHHPDCPAAGAVASAVVIHVLTDQTTLDQTALDPATGARPAAMIGYDGLIPAELIADLAASARLRPLIHPTDSPPEPGYTPSRALADFIRCRDLTCRFPGCSHPATHTDIDHTIAYRDGGPTQAANLKCLCRTHHLLKTFWGWTDEQLRDGTIIWTSPTGDRHVTHPGSALLFPNLAIPTAPATTSPPRAAPCTDKTTMMPRRTRTRAQNRTNHIATERHHNHHARTTPTPRTTYDEHLTYDDTLDPEPPF